MTSFKNKWQDWRHRRNLAAAARWAEPIAGLPRRLRAWSSLLLADHGFLRPVYWNSDEIAPDVWRGAQPNPLHLRKLAQRGLKTVVNLRGNTVYGSYALEKEEARKLSIDLIDLPLYSGAAPQKAQIYALQTLFKTMQRPALLHCKSGADRSGLAAALYLIIEKNRPVAEAVKQLSFRYGHVKSGRTGILDLFFETYLADTAQKPMPFMQWVEEVYDPQVLSAQFSKPSLLRTLVDLIIRRE